MDNQLKNNAEGISVIIDELLELIQTLESEKDDMQDTIDTLNDEVQELQEQIDELKSELNER